MFPSRYFTARYFNARYWNKPIPVNGLALSGGEYIIIYRRRGRR